MATPAIRADQTNMSGSNTETKILISVNVTVEKGKVISLGYRLAINASNARK